MSLGGENMDKIIDFNELKNKVNDKDVDNFESYIYSLYYKMAEGKLTMSEFSKEIGAYMEKNNISQDKFLKMQTKLMERFGIDTASFEEQLKALGLNNISTNPADYEKARKTLSFQEKYKSRLKVKGATEYSIKNEKNNLTILLDDHNVILKSEGKIDLADNELNEFLCSYKKTVENDVLKISLCENTREYDY
ncbi:toxin-antitoxin system toxin component, PIN family [Clostridium celatum DSM 1785]|uniref:Toxin-antitoxin system toxin component, PIN family n=2 Tax=Clostridium celatum TaxID=36834 RepID=L1Q5E4_9CLOT|nr:toxin-antitoxin system toxin component, PIN family [Clostridium celatum DSM 1785]